eukprot:12052914-Ditylum_brightwellii.AAC.1
MRTVPTSTLAKQPGRETDSNSVPNTCFKAAQTWPVPHLQATHPSPPADMTSPIYKLFISFFDKGTPEEWIKFQRGLQA